MSLHLLFPKELVRIIEAYLEFNPNAHNLNLTVPNPHTVHLLDGDRIIYAANNSVYIWEHNTTTCIFTGYNITHVILNGDCVVIIDQFTFIVLTVDTLTVTQFNHNCGIKDAWVIQNAVMCIDRFDVLVRLTHDGIERMHTFPSPLALYDSTNFIYYTEGHLKMWNLHTQAYTLDMPLRRSVPYPLSVIGEWICINHKLNRLHLYHPRLNLTRTRFCYDKTPILAYQHYLILIGMHNITLWNPVIDEVKHQMDAARGCRFQQGHILWDDWVLIQGTTNICWNLQTHRQVLLTALNHELKIKSVVVNAHVRTCLIITHQHRVYRLS